MLCYANTGATITAAKREPRRGALHGAKMSHSQPNQAPRWHPLPKQGEGCTLRPSPSPAAAAGRTGARGPQGSTSGGQQGSATPTPVRMTGLPPASRRHLYVTAICASPARPALRGHHLELCLKSSSAQEHWKS